MPKTRHGKVKKRNEKKKKKSSKWVPLICMNLDLSYMWKNKNNPTLHAMHWFAVWAGW